MSFVYDLSIIYRILYYMPCILKDYYDIMHSIILLYATTVKKECLQCYTPCTGIQYSVNQHRQMFKLSI